MKAQVGQHFPESQYVTMSFDLSLPMTLTAIVSSSLLLLNVPERVNASETGRLTAPGMWPALAS